MKCKNNCFQFENLDVSKGLPLLLELLAHGVGVLATHAVVSLLTLYDLGRGLLGSCDRLLGDLLDDLVRGHRCRLSNCNRNLAYLEIYN